MNPTPTDPAAPADPPAAGPAEPATEAAAPRRTPIRSYVLRGGRLGPGQQRALAELGPRFVLPHATEPFDFEALFGRRAPVVMEIGFGMGDATAAVAAAAPERDFLGCEVHEAGVGALLKQIGERGLSNVRICQHDAVEVLRERVPAASLAGLHLWFPDPWHKKRHHKRRLVQPPFVELVASRLAPGGYLHMATDWLPYAEQMREVLAACAGPAGLVDTSADGSGFVERPAWRPLTKFEARGLRLGHGVRDLVFTKRG